MERGSNQHPCQIHAQVSGSPQGSLGKWYNYFQSISNHLMSVRYDNTKNIYSHILINQDKIVEVITKEHGKSLIDAKGDVFRGYEVVEHACSFTSLAQGETLENVAKGVDLYSYRVPLGVCAGVAPFNFPAMCPLWMFPLAITLGNTYIMKPSEKVPGAMEILLDLLK